MRNSTRFIFMLFIMYFFTHIIIPHLCCTSRMFKCLCFFISTERFLKHTPWLIDVLVEYFLLRPAMQNISLSFTFEQVTQNYSIYLLPPMSHAPSTENTKNTKSTQKEPFQGNILYQLLIDWVVYPFLRKKKNRRKNIHFLCLVLEDDDYIVRATLRTFGAGFFGKGAWGLPNSNDIDMLANVQIKYNTKKLQQNISISKSLQVTHTSRTSTLLLVCSVMVWRAVCPGPSR